MLCLPSLLRVRHSPYDWSLVFLSEIKSLTRPHQSILIRMEAEGHNNDKDSWDSGFSTSLKAQGHPTDTLLSKDGRGLLWPSGHHWRAFMQVVTSPGLGSFLYYTQFPHQRSTASPASFANKTLGDKEN